MGIQIGRRGGTHCCWGRQSSPVCEGFQHYHTLSLGKNHRPEPTECGRVVEVGYGAE
jgi:hypothetical protein